MNDGPRPLTLAEVETFARDWYRKLDEHVPVAELLPMLASDVEFQIPEGVLRGHEGFVELYQGARGWIRSFFDEVHTLSQIAVSHSDEHALVDVVVNWQARRWQPPVPRSQWFGFDAYQQWAMTRLPETDLPVINRYVVNELRPLPGSPPL